MKLDSEEQRQELLGLISQVPAVVSDESGQRLPMTLGVLAQGLPENIRSLVEAIRGAEIIGSSEEEGEG